MQISTPLHSKGDLRQVSLKPPFHAEQARQRRWLRDLKRAQAENRIILLFRPRIALEGGQCVGAEARLRWAPHRRRVLRSNALYALAEQPNEAASLAGWALRAACMAAAGWVCGTIQVSVRVPPALQHPTLLNLYITEALDVSGLSPDRLELRFAEPDLAGFGADGLLWLSAIRDLGVGIALEHFGTGTTSLAMLRRLPLSTLTLTGSLVSRVPQDREDTAILHAILGAARALGLATVADRVETSTQAQVLRVAGCDAAQGRLFADDQTGDEFSRLFQDA